MTGRPGAKATLEGALAQPDFDESRAGFDDLDPAVTSELESIVDASENRRIAQNVPDDPLVVPPVYGHWHRGVSRVADAAAATPGTPADWLVELNLDIRNRAAAGLGVEIVRQRKEEYVQRAWEQVGAVGAANQRLREAELAREAVDTLMRKHIVQAGAPDRILVLTSAAHAGLPLSADAPQSIDGALAESAIPTAAQSAAFRRITRPNRPTMRRLTGGWDAVTFQKSLLSRMNDAPASALSAAPPAAEPNASVALQSVEAAVADSAALFATKKDDPSRIFITMALQVLTTMLKATTPLDLTAAGATASFKTALGNAVTTAYPAGLPPSEVAIGTRVSSLVNAIASLQSAPPDRAVLTLAHAAFAAELGAKVAGKMLGGLTVKSDAPPAGGEISPVVATGDVKAFGTDLGDFGALASSRIDPAPPAPLAELPTLHERVLDALKPAVTIGDRMASALPVIAGRQQTDPRRLAPVMAYPMFPDPLFGPLRDLSQDHIIPNVGDLGPNTITVLEENRRFVEAFLAGVNHAFMAELLWREYPTDQRGTPFKVFWDTRDAVDTAREDILAIDGWTEPLGNNRPASLPSEILVLVIRGELLEKFPRTNVFAQQAKWPAADHTAARVLDPAGEIRQPILHAHLDPDITLVGFDLDEKEARGHRPGDSGSGPDAPGWFFVLMERPGQPRFGADSDPPGAGLQTWNDLSWSAITFPNDTPYVDIAANAALAPAVAQPAAWGRTAADMAAIFFQQPVLLARHASEFLP